MGGDLATSVDSQMSSPSSTRLRTSQLKKSMPANCNKAQRSTAKVLKQSPHYSIPLFNCAQAGGCQSSSFKSGLDNRTTKQARKTKKEEKRARKKKQKAEARENK